MRVWLIGFAVAGFCLARPAWAAPRHSGFTGDLGLGFSYTTQPGLVFHQACDPALICANATETHHDNHFGLASLSLTLGAFVVPQLALGVRTAGTFYFLSPGTDGAKSYDGASHTFYGGIVELWPHDRFYVSGGAGLTIHGGSSILGFSSDSRLTSAFGLDVRAGAALLNAENHDLTVSVEAIPGFYKAGTIVGYALIAAWKWY